MHLVLCFSSCNTERSSMSHEEVFCLCGKTALEVYRASKRLAPDILDKPRTGKMDNLIIPSPQAIEDEMERLDASKPYHILVNKRIPKTRKDVVGHFRTKQLPRRALIKLSKYVYIVSPELLFLDLARDDSISIEDLALIGFELCGTYLLDDSWDGLTQTKAALTSTIKLERFIHTNKGFSGAKRAARALRLVYDGSNSPMETVLAALVTFPRKMGGFGIGPVAMNQEVETADGTKWVDLLIKGANVGLEYKGRDTHPPEQTQRDDRRQNRLVGSGITILNVWYEDLAQLQLLNKLHADIAKAIGKRLRIRDEQFAGRQRILQAQLLPAIERYGKST